MNYIFKGKLCGRICSECLEPLSHVKVRLYRIRKDQKETALATANPKDTFAILTDAMVGEKASFLIAETETDNEGNYTFELGEQQDYDGEAFEVDVYLEKVPGQKEGGKKQNPIQFSITTLQPQWRRTEKGYISAWNHCIPYRFWCAVRARFDAWVICGRILNCDVKPPIPVPGVKVSAFDADWLQDDELGSAITDGYGKFRIDYATSDFEKTPFSPLINIEWIGGPDLYFKIETTGGIPLLEEPRSRGRDPERENVGHCFCVQLCVEEPEEPYENPQFTHVGDFNISSDIDTVSGLTNKAVAGHGGPDFGFFNCIKLKGYCPKTLPGDPSKPMHYRFLYVDPDTSSEIPITGGYVCEVVVGARLVPWDQFGTGIQSTYQTILIRGSGASSPYLPPAPAVPPGTPWGPVSPHIIVPDTQGWIKVDDRAMNGGFYGPLTGFKSTVAVPSGSVSGPNAGDDPSAFEKDGKLLTIIFETATDPSNSATYHRQMLEAKILVNNWTEISLLNLQQFLGSTAGSCTPISNDLNILYTADHEIMRNWRITITTAATVPGGIPVLPSGTGPRGGFGNKHLDVSSWPSCSYRVWLTTRRALTNGEIDDDEDSTLVTFCK